MPPGVAMQLDKAFVVLPVADLHHQRRAVVHAPNEYARIVPYAFSWLRMTLYCALVVLSLGTVLVLSVWFPQVFTHLARQRLPHSSLGRAHYVLILVHDDGFRSLWVEVKINHPPSPPRPGLWARCTQRCRRGNSAGDTSKSFMAIDKRDASKHWVWFEFKKHRYVYDTDKGEYERYLSTTQEDLSDAKARVDSGLVETQRRSDIFGTNVVDIDKPNVALLLFTKIVHPFYLFQVFSVAVWFVEDYVVYAAVVLGMSVVSLLWETFCEVASTWRLRKMVHSERQVYVVRGSDKKDIHEKELVPGDIVVLAEETICADMLLLSGICEVDEASITGEALPVTKVPAEGPGKITDAHHKASMLHAGSKIMRLREGYGECRAVVFSTGFSTGKGELFRSILYPRQLTFEFERDSYRYLALLIAVALAAFVKRLVEAADINTSFGKTVVSSLDLITIAVPPALPLVLSSGVNFALARLHSRGIACMDVRRINSCGQLTCFCFDKTGTLTGEVMTLAGVEVVTEAGGICALVNIPAPMETLPEMLRAGMATCHELSDSGQGFALDKAMFAATQCTLDVKEGSRNIRVASPTADGSHLPEFEILKRFPFDAHVQRSSVLVRSLQTDEMFVWVKGSVEEIRSISTNHPENLESVTRKYAAEGNYCIGFGVKALDHSAMLAMESRGDMESGLEFVGLAYFTNELKPESKAVIAELQSAELDVRMITGDNPYTALHVGRELEMKLKKKVAVVDVSEKTGDVQLRDAETAKSSAGSSDWEHFSGANISRLLTVYSIAITGPALEALRIECENETLAHVLRNTLIFARTRPQQKAWIVEQLMDMGHTVGMCGDGTNDCGALKAAHVGLALLSGVEASLVAPFTSTRKSVADVPVLICEGRCAITTSFLAFKFMVLYPLIQLAMAATLAHFDLALSNNQYVWDDMGIVLGLAITMLWTGASRRLSTQRPPRTLFSPAVAGSIAGQVALFIAFFAGHFALLKAQPTSWFCRIQDGLAYLNGMRAGIPPSCAIYLDHNSENDPHSFEDTSVWLFGHM
ncbi:hypothetical protein PybrP1_004613, partial [[Pythium] brassicae (nom. inval.)]